MKFSAGLLALSLCANAGLLVVLAVKPALAPPTVRDFIQRNFHSTVAVAPPSPARPAPRVATPRPPLWSALATDDPATLIARLRAAGFPPAIIRSILNSEISARYNARLRAFNEPDPNTPFWRLPSSFYSDGDKRYEEMTRLQRERSNLLRDLFRDPFFADATVSAAELRRFGHLPRQKIDQLQRIEEDYSDMNAAVRAGTNGIMLPEDLEKIALLAREKRADLAAILSPGELADYEMRTAPIVSSLISRFGGFEPSEAEFRAIYHAQQSLNEKFPAATSSSIDPQLRQSAQKAMTEQLVAGLGEQRFADYIRETSSEFQQLNRLAQRENLPRETALQAYSLRETVERESNRIFDDASLNPDQKRTALQLLAQNTRGQLQAMLGSVAGPLYVKVADTWLTNVERGGAVRFDNRPPMVIAIANGTMSFGSSPTYRRLPNPPPAP